jgi:hypothetical protein
MVILLQLSAETVRAFDVEDHSTLKKVPPKKGKVCRPSLQVGSNDQTEKERNTRLEVFALLRLAFTASLRLWPQ